MPKNIEDNPLYVIMQNAQQEQSEISHAAEIAEERDKWAHMRGQLVDVKEKLEAAAKQGQFEVEIPVLLKPNWHWSYRGRPNGSRWSDEKLRMMRQITGEVQTSISIPGVQWTSFCPEIEDRYRKCLGQEGEVRSEEDCRLPKCFVKASWNKTK